MQFDKQQILTYWYY